MPRLRAHGAVLAILALGVFLRVAWISEYPAYHSDEGFWGSGARNFLLFGDAFLDNRLHPFLSPATFLGLCAWFGAFTPSLTTARLFSAAFGIATTVLVWDLARTLTPRRTWLPVLFCAVSGLAVLQGRVLLLEAHQTFWLVLATALLFAGGPPPGAPETPIPRRTLLFAGVAYGMALLVKTTSIYLIPAFVIATLPSVRAVLSSPSQGPLREKVRSRIDALSPALLFFLAAFVVAAAGYGVTFARDPERFRAAFRYEMEAKHFLLYLRDPLLFHVGRFGFRPIAATLCALTLARSDPFLCLLGVVGAYRTFRRWSQSTRAARFFSVWAVSGFVFTVLQINVTYRYFGTILPALVFLAAFVAEDLFGEDGAEPARSHGNGPNSASTALLGPAFRVFAFAGVFLGFHLARLSVGHDESPNRDYARVVQLVSEKVPKDTGVLAAPYIGLSLPQKSHDFFRVLWPYGGEDHPLSIAKEIERRRIGVVIRDTEFRTFETPEMTAYLKTACTPLAHIGEYEVLVVKPDGAALVTERGK
ncbi:MAG: phospholipid carrier-dependent glycosyltransferase [Polyangiaceae bacterium]